MNALEPGLIEMIALEPHVRAIGVDEVAAAVVMEAIVGDDDVATFNVQALDVDAELRRCAFEMP